MRDRGLNAKRVVHPRKQRTCVEKISKKEWGHNEVSRRVEVGGGVTKLSFSEKSQILSFNISSFSPSSKVYIISGIQYA